MVIGVTTLNLVVPFLLEAPHRRLQFEWLVVGLLDVWVGSKDLEDKVLNANDVVLSKTLVRQEKWS